MKSFARVVALMAAALTLAVAACGQPQFSDDSDDRVAYADPAPLTETPLLGGPTGYLPPSAPPPPPLPPPAPGLPPPAPPLVGWTPPVEAAPPAEPAPSETRLAAAPEPRPAPETSAEPQREARPSPAPAPVRRPAPSRLDQRATPPAQRAALSPAARPAAPKSPAPQVAAANTVAPKVRAAVVRPAPAVPPNTPPAPSAADEPPATRLARALSADFHAARLDIPEGLGNGLQGVVTLTLPANLSDRLAAEAARLGLAEDASVADIVATLQCQGFAISPVGEQSVRLQAGQPVKMSWMVSDIPGEAKGSMTASVRADLKGAGGLVSLEPSRISAPAPAAPEVRQAGGLGNFSLTIPLVLILIAIFIFARWTKGRRQARLLHSRRFAAQS